MGWTCLHRRDGSAFYVNLTLFATATEKKDERGEYTILSGPGGFLVEVVENSYQIAVAGGYGRR